MRNGEIVRQTTIHLPQALADETKGLGINRSKVAEKALRAEVERVKKELKEQEEEIPTRDGSGGDGSVTDDPHA